MAPPWDEILAEPSVRDQNRRVDIHTFDGDRERLRPLFRLADDSNQEIDRYLLAGEILTALADGDVVGHLQLVDADADGVVELKSMAVIEGHQGAGVGRALVEEAVRRSRARGARLLVVATAAADTGNLRFYQRLEFRMLRIERDAFGPSAGYTEGTVIDGIPLRDRVWLEREL
jgi:GNAT superfamily N-acetyltransferase